MANQSGRFRQAGEILELTNRTLGWLTEKARATIGGKRVRVIKGLRLRSAKQIPDPDGNIIIIEPRLVNWQEELRQISSKRIAS